jgi:Tol biopolymer transport system component
MTTRQFKWFDRAGKELERVGEPITTSDISSMSPDGRLLAVQQSVAGNTDLWVLDFMTYKLTRVTDPPGIHIFPVFSANSRTLYFAQNPEGAFDVYEKPPTSGGTATALMPRRALRHPRHASRDGRFLLFKGGSGGARDVWAIQLDGNPRGEFPVVDTAGADDWPEFSPDGKWVAYHSDESGRIEVYVQPFPTGKRTRVSINGGTYPHWNPNGKELFYLADDNRLMAVPIELEGETQSVKLGTPAALFTPPILNNVGDGVSGPPYAISPDGKRFLIGTVSFVQTPINVIKNWQPQR